MNNKFKPTILYVEDEEEVSEQLSRFLGRFASELYIGNDGEEGLNLYKEHQPDIVITDIKMPKMDGIEMAEAIRDINDEQLIIFTTAYSDESLLLAALEIHIDGYVLKPVNLEILKSKISKVIKILDLQKKCAKMKDKLEELNLLEDI